MATYVKPKNVRVSDICAYVNKYFDTDELSDEDLRSNGINVSNSHVDFMIGTNDLKVVGVTRDNREITIIENGNLII